MASSFTNTLTQTTNEIYGNWYQSTLTGTEIYFIEKSSRLGNEEILRISEDFFKHNNQISINS